VLRLVATGGTIASKVQPDGGVAVALDGRALLATVDGIDAGDVEIVDLFQGPSWNLSLDAVVAIATAARDNDADAVVVTHGTDTLEETAFVTDLLCASVDRPVVVTGSMRNAGQPDGDGPRNLRDAFTVAHDPRSSAYGTVVVLDGTIHAARWVTKTDTQSVHTFASPSGHALGHVDGGRVTFSGAPPPRVQARCVERAPVAIVPSHGDVDPALVDWHLERGVEGIVLEGSGAGNVHAALVPGVERAIGRGVPVVVVSRCATGAVAPVYGGPGGGHGLAALGVIAGGALDARRARLALALAPDDRLRDWFAALVG